MSDGAKGPQKGAVGSQPAQRPTTTHQLSLSGSVSKQTKAIVGQAAKEQTTSYGVGLLTMEIAATRERGTTGRRRR